MTKTNDDVERIRTTVANVAYHIDRRRWDELKALFTAEVETDYTSLFGGTPQKQPVDALIATWRTVLAKVATHHMLGPIEVNVEGPSAAARCYVRAMHHAARAPSGEQWEVLGHYGFELSLDAGRWKVAKMTLETFLQTGNTKLLSEA